MTIRGSALVTVGLVLAFWCTSLSAQLEKPVGVATAQVPAIDESEASADNDAEQPFQESLTFALARAEEDFELPSGSWTGRVVGIPGPESVEKRGVPGLPTFTRTIVAQRKTYRFTMVGSDPFLPRSGKVVVPLQIIPVRLEFDDGTVLDPTIPGPACAGPGTPLTNMLQSPLFTDKDYGEGINRQYVEANRRAEFWAVTGANPGYSVRVAPSVLPTITLTVNGPAEAAPCGHLGLVSGIGLQTLIQKTLLPLVAKEGVNPRTFPLFLLTDVVAPDPVSGGFILGYHSRFGSQTYGVAEYDTSGQFSNAEDISGISHEIGEWYDDPFVNNTTPPWGHIGQIGGCSSLLEVGDPLSEPRHLFEIPMPNGLTYHPQELAFFSWFFDQMPSLGLWGLYSWGGTFTSPAAPCR